MAARKGVVPWAVVGAFLVSLATSGPARAESGASQPAATVRVELAPEPEVSVRLVGPLPQAAQSTECAGPCVRSLEPGAYRLYARRGNLSFPADWVYVEEPRRIEVLSPNRGVHTVGKVLTYTFGTTFALGALIFVPTALVALYYLPCSYGGGCETPSWIAPAAGVGLLSMAGSTVPLLVGVSLMGNSKYARIHSEPLPRTSASRWATGRKVAFEPLGMNLKLSF